MKVLTVVTVAAISGILFINSMAYISNVLAQTWYKKYGYIVEGVEDDEQE
jgi:hypothetical protein